LCSCRRLFRRFERDAAEEESRSDGIGTGQGGRIHGAAAAVTLQLKGLPLSYNKDMQETQEPTFAVRGTAQMIGLLARFTAALEFNKERMQEAAESGYLNAMAAATYLVHKGVPFRKAHEKIGNAVRLARKRCGVERT
jgi:argininosuccinate lyase